MWCDVRHIGAEPWARHVDGIHLAPFEQGEIGLDLFRHACLIEAAGLVSKHRDSAYRAGKFDRWIKVKNRRSSAGCWMCSAERMIQIKAGVRQPTTMEYGTRSEAGFHRRSGRIATLILSVALIVSVLFSVWE